MTRATIWLLLATVLAACSGTAATTTTSPEPQTSTSTSTPQPGPPCVEGDAPFSVGASVVAFGDGEGDAASVAAVRWQPYDGCERIVLDFLTADGAPATSVGSGDLQLVPTSGIVRIRLPAAVTATAVSDVSLEGDLAGRLFIVRDGDGTLFADLHMATSREVRVRTLALGAPARIVVDLADGTATDVVLTPAEIGGSVVLLTPAAGPVEYPITVSGYARTFEANVVVRLYQGTAVALESATTAADWTDTWGWFSTQVATGPSGTVEMFVGEDSPVDGSEQGIRLQLDVR